MSTRLFVAAAVATAVAAGWTGTRTGFDMAEPAQGQAAERAAQGQPTSTPDMVKRHEQMMADMKAADARLDVLVRDMNAAAGDAKVTAVAAVVSELVRQHQAMHGHMGQMHQHMMGMGRGGMMR